MEYIEPIISGEAADDLRGRAQDIEDLGQMLAKTELSSGISVVLAQAVIPGIGEVFNYTALATSRFWIQGESGDLELVLMVDNGLALNVSKLLTRLAVLAAE